MKILNISIGLSIASILNMVRLMVTVNQLAVICSLLFIAFVFCMIRIDRMIVRKFKELTA